MVDFVDDACVEGCAAAVLPGRNEMTGELSYDTGRYVNIAAMGLQINSHCVSTPAVGGLGNGVGGYVRTGKSSQNICSCPFCEGVLDIKLLTGVL